MLRTLPHHSREQITFTGDFIELDGGTWGFRTQPSLSIDDYNQKPGERTFGTGACRNPVYDSECYGRGMNGRHQLHPVRREETKPGKFEVNRIARLPNQQ